MNKGRHQSKRQYHFSMRSTLLIVTCSLSLIPLLVITSLFIMRFSSSTQEEFISTSTNLNHIAINFMDEKIESYIALLDATVTHEDFDKVQDPNYEDLRQTLITLKDSNPSLLNVYFCSEDDDFIQSLDGDLGSDFFPTQQPWYQEAIAQKGGITYDTPYLDDLTGSTVFSIYKGVEKNNKMVGVLCLDINLSVLAPNLESIRYTPEGELLIVAPDGSVVISPDHSMLSTTQPTEYSACDIISTQDRGPTLLASPPAPAALGDLSTRGRPLTRPQLQRQFRTTCSGHAPGTGTPPPRPPPHQSGVPSGRAGVAPPPPPCRPPILGLSGDSVAPPHRLPALHRAVREFGGAGLKPGRRGRDGAGLKLGRRG